jgi:hypothetical protein
VLDPVENTPELWRLSGENWCPWTFEASLPFYPPPPQTTPATQDQPRLRGGGQSTALVAAPAFAPPPPPPPPPAAAETTSVLFAPHARALFSPALKSFFPPSPATAVALSAGKRGARGARDEPKEVLHVRLPTRSIHPAVVAQEAAGGWWEGEFDGGDLEEGEIVDESWTELTCQVLSARTVFDVGFL